MAEERPGWDKRDVFSYEVNEMQNAFSSDMVIEVQKRIGTEKRGRQVLIQACFVRA